MRKEFSSKDLLDEKARTSDVLLDETPIDTSDLRKVVKSVTLVGRPLELGQNQRVAQQHLRRSSAAHL